MASLSLSSLSRAYHFQLIINNALRAYEKRTKKDLLSHPLATQLQTCNSPGDILAVLHQQVQGLDLSRSADDRWTRWLDPTVNVLYTLSETLGEGVSLVGLRTNSSENCTLIYLCQVFSPAKVIFAGVGVLLLVRFLLKISSTANITPTCHRQLRMFEKVKIRSSIFLNASRGFSDASRSTQKSGRPRK